MTSTPTNIHGFTLRSWSVETLTHCFYFGTVSASSGTQAVACTYVAPVVIGTLAATPIPTPASKTTTPGSITEGTGEFECRSSSIRPVLRSAFDVRPVACSEGPSAETSNYPNPV